MADWHSAGLSALYQVLGWFAFAVWSISFYPQVVLNYRRKSVVGLNFDFILFNLTKHSCYLVYNAALYFSPLVQRQYRDKHGADEMIPVATNDVAFSIHAVLLTAITVVQIFIYDRGTQRLSKPGVLIASGVWISALVCLAVAAPHGKWLWLVSVFNILQLVMTGIKYIPQAWMNFQRKSTVGWSIGNILLDASGGIANFFQMAVQSIDQRSVENFSGNVGKVGLSLESIAFDVLFIVQHYFLYPEAPSEPPKTIDRDIESYTTALLDDDDEEAAK